MIYKQSNNFSSNSLEQSIRNICRYEYNYFFSKKNVVGVGFGYKRISGVLTNERCIVVFVKIKQPTNQLCQNDVVSNIYKGIKTDVVESGAFGFNRLTDRVRPVTGGYNIGLYRYVHGGTFGCLVKDINSDALFMLTCNHVLIISDVPKIGEGVIQPSAPFGGLKSSNLVATLDRYVPLFARVYPLIRENIVDCAIAKLILPSLASPSITFIGLPRGIGISHTGDVVKKVGSATEKTTGNIYALGVTITIETPGKPDYLFVNQIITSKMSTPGDSGSLLLNTNNEALGLVIGGGRNFTVCNVIDEVLSRLNVTLITQ